MYKPIQGAQRAEESAFLHIQEKKISLNIGSNFRIRIPTRFFGQETG
jgi:hypothetical protein